jgi:flavin-dependent dehydrogenase
LGRSLRPQAIGIQVHVPDDFTIIRDNTHRLAIYFGDLPDGYGWIFPRKKGASVGICVTAKHARRGRTLLAEFLGTLKLPAELAHTAKGHAIPFYSPVPHMPYCRRGILLAGDAACFVDPITGEGIYYALKSAQAAAEALIRTPANESPAWIYNQVLQQDVIRELSAAWKIAKPLYAFPGASFIAFRDHARLREMHFDILAGRASYADLLSEAPRATLPVLKSLLARII